MKRLYTRFFAVALLLSTAVFAETIEATKDYEYKDYTYSDSTGLTKLSTKDTSYSAVFIIDKKVREILFSDDFKGQTLSRKLSFAFTTYHRRIRLNNDEAVERYNTMYIPLGYDGDLLNLKARSINPDGTITDFDTTNIKLIENYENSGPMKTLAIEGVQVGAEIEYIYTTQIYSTSYYGHIYVQNKYPKKEFSYELIYPDRLEFKYKAYNGAPEMKLDSLEDEKIRLKIPSSSIAAFEKEESSAGQANEMRIEYKLHANNSTNKSNIYSWKRASEVYTESSYSLAENPKYAKKEKKALKKIGKKMKLSETATEREKIEAIESYIKDNFVITTGGHTLIYEIFKKKTATKFGARRLYIQLLEKYNIEHKLVFTSNRFEKTFDGEFESYNFLEKTLLYFPGIDMFTNPSSQGSRLGQIPSTYSYTNGLFLKSKELGGVKAFFPEVKYIKGFSFDQSYDNMVAEIKLDEDFEVCKVFMKKELQGYSSSYIRPYLGYLTEDKKDELLKELLKMVDDTKVTDYTISNSEMKGCMLNYPFKIEGNIEIPNLLEKAGPQYLFKIGQVIGPQMEMYQEKKRKFPVEARYNHSYKRTIKFTIPEGYKIANLKDLNMDVSSSKDGKKTMEFTSKYTLEGNVLTVEVYEFYNEINVPLERFEEFRAVINAAADFNKITLILKKK